MGIKLNTNTKKYDVSYSKRHPKTRIPFGLKRTGITSKGEASKVFAKLVVEVEDRLRRTLKPTWAQLLTEYFEFQAQKGLTKKTLYSDERCIKKYTEEEWGKRICDSISRADLHTVVDKLMSDKAQSHRQYVLKCLRGVFGFAIERGYIDHNPTPIMKFRIHDKIKPVLTEPQAKLLLERALEMESEWYPHWSMALYTGMRNGELYALQWDAVDLGQRRIRVCRSWNNKDGFKDTKSGDDRIIDISPHLMPLIQDLFATRLTDFVLPRIRKWDKGEQARELRGFMLGMGLPAVRFHDLRATWATLLLGRSVAPVKVMKMGGWKDMETMMIYIRKAGIDVSGALEGLKIHEHHPKLGDILPIRTGL